MKQTMKNETDMMELINKMHALLIVLDKKLDTLIHQSLSDDKPASKPPMNNTNMAINSNDRNKARVMHQAICADCKKECSIPFKPSGDRPVYCQDCFARRKVIKLSGVTFADKPKEAMSVQTPTISVNNIPKVQVKTKKKAVTVKKTIGKKKPVPKKK